MLKYNVSVDNYYVELRFVFCNKYFFLTILIYLSPAGDLYKPTE